ncbi:hypothetical protein GCM10009605_45470 [Nocardiopsis composta]
MELMAAAPVLLLAALLMVAAGRQASAAMDVASAAHSVARAASLETDPARRGAAARTQAGASLAERGLACADHTVTVHTTGPQRAQSVRADLSCHLDLADVALLGLPGRLTVHGTSTAPVDPHRDQEAHR